MAASQAALDEKARRLALQRYRLLRPHLEQGRPVREVAAAAGVALRTVQRWVAQYQRTGLAALVRKPRADRRMLRGVSDRLKEAVEGLALQRPPLPVAALFRQAKRMAAQLGEKPPSYGVVYRIIRGLPADLVTLAHEGAKAYQDEFELVHRREAPSPNAIWQADHSLLDVLLLRDGQLAKPWLTIVLDDFSRAVAGYLLSFEPPSALHTSLALRQAIWRKEDPRWSVCGLPDILYVDHGSDFISEHLEQVGADLRIQLVFSLAGVPRGRGRIERFFSTVNEMLLCELDGYAPAGGAVRGRAWLTLPELDARFRSFLLDVYHRRPSSETKVPPVERWQASGFLPRMPDSLEQLDLLLVHVAKSRQVHVDGIHFQGLRYTSLTLAAYVGETVTLRFDPRDMAEIRIFHEERFLCRALCAELAGEVIPLRELVRARKNRRHELRTVLRQRQAVVDGLIQVKHGEATETSDAPRTQRASAKTPTLKRYRNE